MGAATGRVIVAWGRPWTPRYVSFLINSLFLSVSLARALFLFRSLSLSLWLALSRSLFPAHSLSAFYLSLSLARAGGRSLEGLPTV
jgi:hypothetical protein